MMQAVHDPITNKNMDKPLCEKDILFLSKSMIVKRIGNKKGNSGLAVKPPTILEV